LRADFTSPCALRAPPIICLSREDNMLITVLYNRKLKFLHLRPTAQMSLRERQTSRRFLSMKYWASASPNSL
jgi:hypothetical protein